VLFPKAGFTTDDLVAVYEQLATVLLPHAARRPMTLKRYPDDVYGESFWEKNAPAFTPKWVKRMPVPRRNEPGVIEYIGLEDLRSLRWAASLGCIELHTFLHKYPYITQPTVIAFDLDPGEGVHLPTCCGVALDIREWFARRSMECFPKVSGSKGLQVYVPLNTRCSYELTEWLARRAAEELERKSPRRITSRMERTKRAGKVFIDWSQNADYKTTVCVYSLRAQRNHPYVSAPVDWNEVERADMHHLVFRPEDVIGRVKKMGDLFKPVLTMKQEIPEELWHKSGVRAIGPPKAVRVAHATDAEPRSSKQGGRRRFAVRQARGVYELGIERDGEFMVGEFDRVPSAKEEKISGRDRGAHGPNFAIGEDVWDLGTYEIVEGSFDKNVVNAYFDGERLRGEWFVAVGLDGWIWMNNGGRSARIARRRSRAKP
jgi:bifunctional non-homologous end joining protein LigD